jgi:CBS domain containing-hemolysin-like protein
VIEYQAVVVSGLIILLLLDLVTVAARSGLRYLNLARLLQLRDQIGENADRALAIMHASPRAYAGLHLVQSLTRFLIIGCVLALIPWEQITPFMLVLLGVPIIVALLLGWLEWIVERAISRHPEDWVLRLTPFIQVLTTVFSPLVLVSLFLSQDTSSPPEGLGMVTEDELKTLVDAGQQEGVLEQEEREMIYSVFQLGDTLTREIMVPRIDMLAVEENTPLVEALDALLESGYTRVPVYRETVDNIIGLLYAKDLLRVWREGNTDTESLQSLLRDAYFVPEAKKVVELLEEMQSRRVHMTMVVDEYGGIAGLVTMEDIIEEIFGEIQDEYDEEEQPYQRISDGEYIFQGRIDLDDFNEIVGSNLPNNEADTLSGFIYMRLGHVPTTGESVEDGNLRLTVEQVSSRRIRKVRAERLVNMDGE